MSKGLMGCYLLALIGVALLLPGAYLLARASMQYLSFAPADGIVSEMRSRSAVASGCATMAYPVVRFQTATGAEITVMGACAHSSPPFQEGDAVAVCYNPANPQEAMIVIFFEVFGLASLLSGFGLAEDAISCSGSEPMLLPLLQVVLSFFVAMSLSPIALAIWLLPLKGDLTALLTQHGLLCSLSDFGISICKPTKPAHFSPISWAIGLLPPPAK